MASRRKLRSDSGPAAEQQAPQLETRRGGGGSSSQVLYYVACAVLFFVLFFSQFKFVGGSAVGDVCSGRGYKNATTGRCNCLNNYYGYNCHLKLCPFGPSWHSIPVANQTRNREYVACSNMGECDPMSGLCSCRPGFEGRACERFSCAAPPAYSSNTDTSVGPLTNYYPDGFTTSTGSNPTELVVDFAKPNRMNPGGYFFSQPGDNEPYSQLPVGAVVPCSGHGVCRTMAEAAAGWNGLNLVRPPVAYSNWEADAMQGCLCDYGWSGFDCASRQCPFGRDPMDTRASEKINEKLLVSCHATQGYFTLYILGRPTQPIPADADPGLLKYLLEQVPNVGIVNVTMAKGADGLPAACTSTGAVTTIELASHPGRLRHTVRVDDAASNTRAFPFGSTPLFNAGGPLTQVRMLTQYELTCPPCVGCSGYVYFLYGDSVSDPVDVTAVNTTGLILAQISALANLTSANFPLFDYAATSSIGARSALCPSGGTKHVVTISLYSTIGNIGGLSILDSTIAEDAAYVSKGFGGIKVRASASPPPLPPSLLHSCLLLLLCPARLPSYFPLLLPP